MAVLKSVKGNVHICLHLYKMCNPFKNNKYENGSSCYQLTVSPEYIDAIHRCRVYNACGSLRSSVHYNCRCKEIVASLTPPSMSSSGRSVVMHSGAEIASGSALFQRGKIHHLRRSGGDPTRRTALPRGPGAALCQALRPQQRRSAVQRGIHAVQDQDRRNVSTLHMSRK